MPKVKIVNGQIHFGAPPLIHQLFIGEKPADINYTGEAQIIYDKIRIPGSEDLAVDPSPTFDSSEYNEGWKYALAQKKAIEPKPSRHSAKYYQGWLDGWKAKRKAMEK